MISLLIIVFITAMIFSTPVIYIDQRLLNHNRFITRKQCFTTALKYSFFLSSLATCLAIAAFFDYNDIPAINIQGGYDGQ